MEVFRVHIKPLEIEQIDFANKIPISKFKKECNNRELVRCSKPFMDSITN